MSEIEQLSEALSELEQARLAAAGALFRVICLRGQGGTNDNPAWAPLDSRLSNLGMPGTGTPSDEFLGRCCF